MERDDKFNCLTNISERMERDDKFNSQIFNQVRHSFDSFSRLKDACLGCKNTQFIVTTRSQRNHKLRNGNDLRKCLNYESHTVPCFRV